MPSGGHICTRATARTIRKGALTTYRERVRETQPQQLYLLKGGQITAISSRAGHGESDYCFVRHDALLPTVPLPPAVFRPSDICQSLMTTGSVAVLVCIKRIMS